MKNAACLFVTFMMCLAVAGCGGGSEQSKDNEIARLKERISQLETKIQKDQSNDSNGEDGAGQVQLKKEIIHKNGIEITKYGSWIYWDQVDPMTDEVLKCAQNQSENKAAVGYGSTVLALGLNYTGNVTAINFIISRGSFRTEVPQVYVRFDKGEIETYGCMVDNSKSIYIMDGERFMNGLKNAKKFVVQVESIDGGKATFTFNNSGYYWNYPVVNN